MNSEQLRLALDSIQLQLNSLRTYVEHDGAESGVLAQSAGPVTLGGGTTSVKLQPPGGDNPFTDNVNYIPGPFVPDDPGLLPFMQAVKRVLWRGPGGMTAGSFWYFKPWDMWITASHVHEGMSEDIPPFAKPPAHTRKELIRPEGRFDLDACAYGSTGLIQGAIPPWVTQQMRLAVIGYPAGCTQLPEVRTGFAYLRRGPRSWIMVIDDGMDPVFGGMSGGMVVGKIGDIWVPIGICIEQNSPTNIDDDAWREDSLNFVPLCDLGYAILGTTADQLAPNLLALS